MHTSRREWDCPVPEPYLMSSKESIPEKEFLFPRRSALGVNSPQPPAHALDHSRAPPLSLSLSAHSRLQSACIGIGSAARQGLGMAAISAAQSMPKGGTESLGALKRAGTVQLNMRALMRPAPGPDSDFFKQHKSSKASLIYRNSKAHWHVHWYVLTRGRPLLDKALLETVKIASRKLSLFSGPNNQSSSRQNSIDSADGANEIDKLSENNLTDMHDVVGSKSSVAKQRSLRERIWRISEQSPVINSFILVVITLGTSADVIETGLDVEPGSSAAKALTVLDVFCVTVFTIEFLLRVCCCPSLCSFIRSPMNWIDFLAIVPSYVGYIMQATLDADALAANANALDVSVHA
jgi:hypothetical protein